MTSTSISLSKQIPPKLIETLRKVWEAAESLEIPVFVIGATARDIVFEYIYSIRPPVATADIDFGVMAETWEDFSRLRKRLLDVNSFIDVDSRFKFKDHSTNVPIDIVPFGGLEDPSGSITFGYGGKNLTTAGFREAIASSIEVEANGFKFRVASIPGLVLLKLISFYDRPMERERDIQDIWLIFKRFLDLGNEERLYSEHNDLLDEPDFDLELAAPRMLGRDVAMLLTEHTRKLVAETLADDEASRGMNLMISMIQRHEDPLDPSTDKPKRLIESFKRGLSEGIR
jgi:predicted nucleotidyltransferase